MVYLYKERKFKNKHCLFYDLLTNIYYAVEPLIIKNSLNNAFMKPHKSVSKNVPIL